MWRKHIANFVLAIWRPNPDPEEDGEFDTLKSHFYGVAFTGGICWAAEALCHTYVDNPNGSNTQTRTF